MGLVEDVRSHPAAIKARKVFKNCDLQQITVALRFCNFAMVRVLNDLVPKYKFTLNSTEAEFILMELMESRNPDVNKAKEVSMAFQEFVYHAEKPDRKEDTFANI
jgi:hypothetical protein